MTTATYTQEQLTKREFTRSKLEAIAIEEMKLNSDVVRLAPTKNNIIEMILLAQEEEAVGTEPQVHAEDPDVVQVEEYLEEPEESDDDDEEFAPALPDSAANGDIPWQAETAEMSYEQRLLLWLDRNHETDTEAAYLLTNWAEFKASLEIAAPAQPTRRQRQQSGESTPRTSDPAAKIALAKEVWEKVQELGTPKAAAEAVGKSAHYVKMIARAYGIYQQSEVIRNAFDGGSLPWAKLYDLAFRNRVEKDGLEVVEAEVQAA